ncbi:Uncharacterised protein [Bordetella pertussis]|nr:Uncharacterised protein [Bordetella pertussis]
MAVAASLGLLAHRADQGGLEGRGGKVLDVAQIDADRIAGGVARAQRLAGLAQAGVHLGQARGVRVAQVDRERHLAGNDVARGRIDVGHAHGAAPLGGVVQRDAHDFLHQVRGGVQGVAAHGHGRGAGVRLHAGHGDVVPAQAERAGDHADDLVLGFQDGALLDMRLEVLAQLALAHRRVAGVADARQLVAHRFAVHVGGRQRRFEREDIAEHAGPHHDGHEARAFLVGPDRQFQRRLGAHVVVLQRAHDLQSGQDAEASVELAAGGLGVDVAAGGHAGQFRTRAGPAAEDVADLVDGDFQARFAHPAHQQVAALAVQFGQRQAAIAALGRGADFRQLHERVPQALAVDRKCGGSSHDEAPLRVRLWRAPCPAGRLPAPGRWPAPYSRLPGRPRWAGPGR